MSIKQPATNLAEMRALLARLPGPDLEAATAAAWRAAQLAEPRETLGRLDVIAAWLATWQARHPPAVTHPRTAIFAGSHGTMAAATGDTTRRVATIVNGGGAVNQLCAAADADLRVYEMSLDAPTADITKAAAMNEEDCALAIAYGMMAVEPGIDLLALAAIGAGGAVAAAALASLLWGGAAADWADPEDAAATAAAERAVARHRTAGAAPFELLRRLGGREFAAVAGAVMAARQARVPVLLGGFAATVAASVLAAEDPHALDHCLVASGGPEPGQKRLITRLGKAPLVDLGLEGAPAATLAIAIVKAAALCHAGMTLAER